MVGNIINDQWNNILSPEVIETKFECSFNILDYYRLKYLVKKNHQYLKEEEVPSKLSEA